MDVMCIGEDVIAWKEATERTGNWVFMIKSK